MPRIGEDSADDWLMVIFPPIASEIKENFFVETEASEESGSASCDSSSEDSDYDFSYGFLVPAVEEETPPKKM